METRVDSRGEAYRKEPSGVSYELTRMMLAKVWPRSIVLAKAIDIYGFGVGDRARV